MNAKRFAAIILLFGALAVLLALGTWQAGRFIDKRERFDAMEERLPLAPVRVSTARELEQEDLAWRRVELTGGEWLPSATAGIARRFYKNRPGYWVLTPYRFEDGSVAFVQRGWSPEPVWKDAAGEDLAGYPAIGLLQPLGEVNPDVVARAALEAGEFDIWRTPEIGEPDLEVLYDALQVDDARPTVLVVLGEDYAEVRGEQPPIPDVTHLTQPYLTPMTHFGYAFLWYGAAVLLCWLFWAGWTGRLDPSYRARRDD